MMFWLRVTAFLLIISLMLVQGCIGDLYVRPASIARPPDLILLTRDPLFESVSLNMHPSWSPDSRELVFERDVFLKDDHGLCVVQADGTRPTMLWPIGSTGYPAWSPVGGWIACSVYTDGKNALTLLNRDGQRRQYVTDRCYAPSWSPDGQRLVCVSYQSVNDRAIILVDWQGTRGASQKFLG